MMEEEGARNQRPGGNTKILALGDNGNCLLYDSGTGLWEEWPAPPVADHGTHFSAVVVGGNIFIIGGQGQVNNVRQARVSIYNVERGAWRNGPNLLEARYGFGACVSSTNSIYVVGGFAGNHAHSVEMLNCDENGEPIGVWQRLRSTSNARRGVETAIVGDKVYAIGGNFTFAAQTMEVFDPRIFDRRPDCKRVPREYYLHAVSTCNGEIYVFGENGFCEKYNPVNDAWTAIARLNTITHSRGSAVLNDKIYLIGGENNCTETDIYNVAANAWLRGPPMPRPIGRTKCVLLN